jgi:outer membrane protein assembly factor BamD (BamD/ComL family)
VLRRAFSAMSQGRWPSAIGALDEHARLFPSGRLKEQREAMMIQALRGAGKTNEADSRGKAFVNEYPDSLLVEKEPPATP